MDYFTIRFMGPTIVILLVFLGVAIWGILYSKKNAKEWKQRHKDLLSAKISSEARLGAIGEHLSPFLSTWPFKDPKTFCPLGAPIDGIDFSNDCITIVEIKTGGARLSKQQKRIKNLVEQGKFKFIEFRIAPDGVKIKETLPFAPSSDEEIDEIE